MKDKWRLTRLGDVCDVEKEQALHAGLPYVGLEHIGSGTGEFLGSMSPSAVKSSTFRFTSEHVLYGRLRPYLNKVLLPDFEGHCSTEIFPLKPVSGVSRQYLFHWLSMDATVKAIDATSTGARMPRANMTAVLDFELPVPPLPEQRRIVSILEESFDAIATAKANTDKNLRNARELFNSHLQTVFVQKAVGWSTTTVRQLVHDGVLKKPQDGNHGEIHPTRADYVDVGVPFIMAADLANGKVDTQNCRFIADTTARGLRIGFSKTGDVLLSHKGTIGRVAILESSDEYVVLTPQVTYYRVVDESRLFNGFLYYCLRSPEFQAEMNRIAGAGSTRAYIGITRQLDLQIALPKIDAQHELVAQLKQSEDVSRALENSYGRKLAALDELKKSLLHQAFTGKLTAKTTDKQLESVA